MGAEASAGSRAEPVSRQQTRRRRTTPIRCGGREWAHVGLRRGRPGRTGCGRPRFDHDRAGQTGAEVFAQFGGRHGAGGLGEDGQQVCAQLICLLSVSPFGVYLTVPQGDRMDLLVRGEQAYL